MSHKAHPTKMDELLNQSKIILEHFLSPEIDISKQIPVKILKNAKGIIIIRVLKGGLMVGGESGDGILLLPSKKGDGWSQPIAISLIGIKFGFQIGGAYVDNIIVFDSEKCVNTFCKDGQLTLGSDINITVGPYGRDANVSVVKSVENKDYCLVYTYSLSKGIYADMSFKSDIIKCRTDINEDYYGKKCSLEEIINGNVSMRSSMDYSAICAILRSYINKGVKTETENEPEAPQMMNTIET